MAIPHDFPTWNPQYGTKRRFYNRVFRTRYIALRSSSSAFIKRNDVRKIISDKCDNKCSICGSTENLQIDHKKSVYQCAQGIVPIEELNIYDNLTLLCRKCNVGRCPNG